MKTFVLFNMLVDDEEEHISATHIINQSARNGITHYVEERKLENHRE